MMDETFARFKKLEKEYGFSIHIQSMYNGVREWHATILGPRNPYDSMSTILGECTSLDMCAAIDNALDRAELKVQCSLE